MATKRATGTGRSGKSMLNTANSKQTNPARLAGSSITAMGSRPNGRGSTGVAPLGGSGASVQDTAGRGGRNAVGKVTRGGARRTTSLG